MAVSALQPANADAPISAAEGRVTSARAAHRANAPAGTSWSAAAEISADFSAPQSANALAPSAFTAAGSTTLSRELQLANAEVPIFSTVAGMIISLTAVEASAPSPMAFSVAGSVTSVSEPSIRAPSGSTSASLFDTPVRVGSPS